MAQEMHRLGGGTSEEEDEEMDIKEEEGYEGDASASMMIGGVIGEVDAAVAYFIQPPAGEAAEQLHHAAAAGGESSGGGGRRCRPKEEKERTKLRERHRRAITARILAGLRRHGNYNLRVRADINEVIAALAREAGWTVLPDGTTFPSREVSLSPPLSRSLS